MYILFRMNMERKEEIKTKKSINYRRDFTKLSGDVKSRYEDKIRLCGGIDPYSIKENELSLVSNDFPVITLADIANYMISSTSPYTKVSFNAYKSTEAYKFFESGFVLNIGTKIENDLSILKGRVRHSQKMNETPADAWVLAKMNGQIICAHCTCTAGLSETCSHVGAICFAIASMRESTEIKSVTDELCKWNVPSFKEVSMSQAVNINWKLKPTQQKGNESNFRLYCDSLTHLSDERIFQFIEKCNSDGNTTALETILFPERIVRKTNIRDEIFLASLYNAEYQNKSHCELVDLGRAISLNITNDEVKEISHSTLPHLKSKCCVGLRRGRVTGLQFKNCCEENINSPRISTIRQVISPTILRDVPSVKYQIKNKKNALDQYKSIVRFDHAEFTYSTCGLIINPKIPYFVGSNDGLLYCACHGNGCLEIKCLKILESNPSFDILTNKPNNILNKEGNLYVIEKSHELFYELQLKINLIGLSYCDLMLWSPEEFLVITVEPDVCFWKTNMQKAIAFHEHVIMPELLGKFYTKNDESGRNKTEKEELIELEIEILNLDEEPNLEEHQHNGLDERKKIVASESLRKKQILQNSKRFNLSDVPEVGTGFTDVRNLMNLSIEEILLTFTDHEDVLKRLYNEHISKFKRNYKANDLPDLVALDVVDQNQFREMVIFAETKLAKSEEHYATDVIFDAIIPEWTIRAFCKKFNYTRIEAVEILKIQSRTLAEHIYSDV